MFDFSAGELGLVMVVALVVIGPERLPKVARTLGHLYGRAQRYVNTVKADISRDMALDEYRKLQEDFQVQADALHGVVKQTGTEVSEQMQQINQAVVNPVLPATAEMPAEVSAEKIVADAVKHPEIH